MKLNTSQLCAIRHTEGPMLVLAGPGSGKTTVIITRIIELITTHNIQPEHILAVTFSRASANEMKDRFHISDASVFGNPEFATFHSIFLKILKEYTGPLCPDLITDKDKELYFRSELEALFPENDNIAELVDEYSSAISRLKSNTSSSQADDMFLRELYTRYTSFLLSKNLMDFDDIISRCLKLFINSPDILEKCQNRYRYILIDEFQDISPMQYETIKLLAGKNRNIFAVGDDDQSIYGFRGAAPGMLKRFIREHPDIRQISLNINYRCPESILRYSGKLISKNADRIVKDQIPVAANENDQMTFSTKEYPSRNEEYEYIINSIKRIIFKSGDVCAVLFRNNMDSSLFIKMLEDSELPFEFKGKRTSLSDHFIIKDLISYLKAAFYCRKEDLIRIINRPCRYISRNALTGTIDASGFRSMYEYYRDNDRILSQIKGLYDQLMIIKNLPPYPAVRYIRKAIGYENWLKEYAIEHHNDMSEYTRIIDMFEEYAENYSSIESLLACMEEQTDHIAWMNKQIKRKSYPSSIKQIQIMTMHAAKGLEYDHVFIPDVNEGVIPSVRSVKTKNIEEERRLLYVAMTRARKTLMISWSSHMHNTKAAPSMFITDILEE